MRTLVVILCGCLWMTSAARAEPRLPEIAFERYVLPNGLQVILHVDKKLPLVHVNLWYHVGSKNEQPGRTGFAHLFEHVMLQGSKHAPENYFSLMARAGAKGGRDSNGTTSHDRTNYFATAPSGSLEYLLWIHADLLATLPDALTQAKLDNQREVVRNEKRQGIDNAPYGRAYKLLPENLFPSGHPYSWPVIGSDADLQAASLEDVKQFFRTYYAPNNLSLVVSGDFDPAQARAFIEKHFGSIPPGPALDRPRHDLPPLQADKIIEVNDRVAQERVYMAWLMPALGDAGEHELELAAHTLTHGLSSRLQKALIYERRLCTSVDAEVDARELAGVFVLDAKLRPGAALAEVERVIDAEIAKLAHEGPTAAELERARSHILTRTMSSLQSIGAFGGTADLLNHYNVFYGDPGKLRWDLARMLAVTPQSERAAVAKWLASTKRVVLRFHPESSRQAGNPEPDRSKAPALGAPSPFIPPTVQSGKLTNGLELYVVERHELPLVSAALVSRAGSVFDPAGKEGLASVVTATMQRGTRTRSALQLADALGDLGTSLASYTTLERAGFEVEVQRVSLERAVPLLADIARHPALGEAELDRERKLQTDSIQQAELDGPQLARRLRPMFTFGREHPYGRPTSGYRGTLASLSRADALAFHAATWRPADTALFFSGDITLAEATRLAQKAFGDWRGAEPAPPPVAAPAQLGSGRIVIVDKPDAAQTTITQLYAAPTQKDDDYYRLRLASDVLGANAAGRLYMNLRQDKGYTYGFGCSVQPLTHGMLWFSQGDVQTDKTKESVVELVEELRGIAGARPITPKELEDARLALIRNYAAGFGTNTDVARKLVELWSRRWPMAELALEPEALARASLAEVLATAKRYAVPAQSALILIGDRAKIEGPVRKLGLGEVLITDVEGRPLPAAE